MSGAACQFALMAARALSSGVSVVNGKRQSDDHDDQNDEFIVAHMITPFCAKRVSAKRHLFPSCRGLPPHTAYHIYLPFVNISVWTEAAARIAALRGLDMLHRPCYNKRQEGMTPLSRLLPSV